ncbi:MAG: hypothetical protein JXB50_02775 [Spirochaetes bacterium]|nr:hypothetical protein [Spirochaetota bacterium]
MNIYQVIEKLIRLIKDYNDNSKNIKNIDRMFECLYCMDITYPSIGKKINNIVQGIDVVLKMIYSSGGSEESFNLINDVFSFTLTDNRIINIKKEIENSKSVEINDLQLTDENLDILIKYIIDFFNRILPKSC